MATIALDNLKPQEQLKLSPLPQDTTDYASIINSAVGNPMELDKQVQGQETQVQSSLNTLSNLMQEGAGIGSQQLAMENQAGISQQQKEVQDLTNQLNAIKTQANVIPMQIQQESAGRGRTEAGIAPLQTAELRNNAIQALTVGAQLQAKQGNLALAQNQIDRAIELKYRDIENRTKLAELNYNRNKETLERIDKKRADALGYAIQKQKEKDAENKANETAIQNMIVEATPNAPASVIANARKLAESGASRLAVAQSLGVYGGDYLKTQLLKAQIETEKAQKAKYYADIDSIRSKLTGTTTGTTGINPSKFSAGSKTNYQNLQGVVDSIDLWAKQIVNSKGEVAGTGAGAFVPSKLISQDAQNSRTALNALNLKVQQWASGASLTESQTDMVDKFMPKSTDSDSEIQRKLNSLAGFMNTQINTIAKSEGQQANLPTSLDMFSSVNTPSVKENKFNQSLGIPTTPIQGTSIVNKVSEDGSIEFNIPKQTP